MAQAEAAVGVPEDRPLTVRTWRYRAPSGNLCPIAAVDEQDVVLVDGTRIRWRLPGEFVEADPDVVTVYRVPHRRGWTLWKRGNIGMLAQDLGNPWIRRALRAAQTVQRRQR